MRRAAGHVWRTGHTVPDRMAALAVCAALLVAACGGDGADVDPLEQAQTRVTRAQEAVSEAQTAFDDATTGFCEDSEEYITAIDRYGKAFDESAATVGDVKTAGADLVEPREAVEASAQNVVDAGDELADATQELAEAEAALAAAQSWTSSTSTPASTTTTAPLVSAANVDRVEQAEADLAAASEGITDRTPLTEATAQFNAAAFALEVAWLQLFEDAGCLTDEQQQQAVAAVADYTTALQTSLQAAGYYDGEIDGVYGPGTVDAVEQLQTANGLPVTGLVDRATAAALQAALLAVGGEAATQAVAHTAAVQSTLKLAGYWTGPVDGTWTPELTEALMTFQSALGVPPTGAVDAATLSALQQAITEAQSATTSTTTTTTTTTVPATTTTSSG
jgi:murein L,D-transpeptidase YcbB/YkuD